MFSLWLRSSQLPQGETPNPSCTLPSRGTLGWGQGSHRPCYSTGFQGPRSCNCHCGLPGTVALGKLPSLSKPQRLHWGNAGKHLAEGLAAQRLLLMSVASFQCSIEGPWNYGKRPCKPLKIFLLCHGPEKASSFSFCFFFKLIEFIY